MTQLLAEYFNSENERITIEKVLEGKFKGQKLLVIHDNEGTSTVAPMLLDKGTMDWLKKQLEA